jgi:hypothetical protein
MLKFDPKFYYANVSLFGPEVDVNAISETQVVNLVKTEMESTQQDMIEEVSTLLYGVGTGDNPMGVQGIIDDGTYLSTYGELDRSVYTKINSNVNTVGGPVTLALMAAQNTNARFGRMKPTLCLTTEALWDDLEELIQPQLSANYTVLGNHQVTRDSIVMPGTPLGPGMVGFDAIMHRGVPVTADSLCNDGEMYFINENYITWYAIKSQWASAIALSSTTIDGPYAENVPSKNHGFHWTGFKEPHNQYARNGQILLLGNLVSGGPRYHAKLESLT